MQKKTNNLLEKIVKKDYNNELEEVLENKDFDEYAKSTLLGILYKIEASYKDIETVKKDIKTKDEYIANIISIVKNNCKSIKILKMSEKNDKIPEHKTYVIDKKNKSIITYPIERKILYAIAKISNKEKIVKDDYYIINETLTELLNVGYNIDIVEPLRDFNGYSWTTIPQEIESIDHNLIYQILRILVGHKFLDKWIKDNEFMIDYFYEFAGILEDKYGKENSQKIIDLLNKISILLSAKFDKDEYKKILNAKQENDKQLSKINDREKFIEETTQKKIAITKEIKKIDEKINNKELLQKEYIKRNEELDLEHKIFSMRVLSKILKNEKEEKLKKLAELNDIMNPKDFIKYQNKLEKRNKYLSILNEEDIDKTLNKLKIEMLKSFLICLKIDIKKAESKQEIEKVIYDFRYYLLLQYDYNNKVKDLEEIIKDEELIAKIIIKKAIEFKIFGKITEDEEKNYQILKKLFTLRIIKLEDAHLKITKEKGKQFLKVFDEKEFEEKIQLE